MESVFDVAQWFLHKKSFTHKQLQKLCYYAQAQHLALLNKPLFESDIEAWVHGPVIPALYHCYANYGWEKIKRLTGKSLKFEDDTLEVLKAVYRTYSKFDRSQLESLIYSELPWIEARSNLALYEICNNPISLKTMGQYYGEKYKQAQGE